MQYRTSAVAAQAATPPPLQGHADSTLVSIELSAPLTGPRGAISSLELKEPTLGDYLDCGALTRNIAMDPSGEARMRVEVVEDPQAFMRWMCRLTGQPEAVLRTMRPRDAHAIRREIGRIVAEFEMGNLPAAPTSSSSSSA